MAIQPRLCTGEAFAPVFDAHAFFEIGEGGIGHRRDEAECEGGEEEEVCGVHSFFSRSEGLVVIDEREGVLTDCGWFEEIVGLPRMGDGRGVDIYGPTSPFPFFFPRRGRAKFVCGVLETVALRVEAWHRRRRSIRCPKSIATGRAKRLWRAGTVGTGPIETVAKSVS